MNRVLSISIAVGVIALSTLPALARYQRVGLGTGTINRNQLIRLNYLARGQSQHAMISWSGGRTRYLYAVQDNSEYWRLEDEPGTYVRVDYVAGRYADYGFSQGG